MSFLQDFGFLTSPNLVASSEKQIVPVMCLVLLPVGLAMILLCLQVLLSLAI